MLPRTAGTGYACSSIGWTGADGPGPDLAAYRDYLLHDYTGHRGRSLSPSSVSSHLATIRGRYHRLLREDCTRDRLYRQTPADASAADKKAYVDEVLTRLHNAIHPDSAPVKVISNANNG